ncbi:hypothetical protein OQJ19_12640 [Fluoribacter gormanii]|uniref:hypothetical protein n=1 Tax=Fluoribacter gormanii TaxID=464 RepID=UPI002243B8C5|nr:hypothetical protein [Fluoribacter gormanii]MCW8471487.1 hypothetical protein [Fluoribacter gormanii]
MIAKITIIPTRVNLTSLVLLSLNQILSKYKIDHFQGMFDETICHLNKIKRLLINFPPYVFQNETFFLWRPKGGDINVLFNQIHPVITERKEEYKSFLLNLCILIIDGLDEKVIRDLAQGDQNTKSLQGLEIFLNSWGSSSTKIIMSDLRELQRKRSKNVAMEAV